MKGRSGRFTTSPESLTLSLLPPRLLIHLLATLTLVPHLHHETLDGVVDSDMFISFALRVFVLECLNASLLLRGHLPCLEIAEAPAMVHLALTEGPAAVWDDANEGLNLVVEG